MNEYLLEKDAIAFLGLMSIAFKNFDKQFIHADGTPTHTKGLNIFAAIIDNIDGEVIGQKQNNIHENCNPMLHAEQLTLKEAIDKLKSKRPKPDGMSVENYYRNFLFNKQSAVGDFNVGCTIYTTLEPCPFCTSALLVNRMKRIVYIIPDAAYGQSYFLLKDKFYKSYDITYESIKIPTYSKSTLINFAGSKLKWLVDYTNSYPQNATLYLDSLNEFLKECSEFFLGLVDSDLITINSDLVKNTKTLLNLQKKAQ